MGAVGGHQRRRQGIPDRGRIAGSEERGRESTAEEGTLTITGERRFEREEKGKKYHRVELAYGSFVRNFSLPDDASPSKGSAEFKDGVLTVHLAETEKAKPRQIEFKVV